MENEEDQADVEAIASQNQDSSSNNNAIKPTSSFLNFFSSIFKSKPTPTEGQCQQNLERIGLELHKAQQMIDTTHNASVQSACARRIAKLNYEKRFFQIIKEQYKIKHMHDTTTTGSVKFACQERLKQLMSELESLEVERKKLANAEETIPKKSADEWYQRATQYVNAANMQSTQQQQQTHLGHPRQNDYSTYIQPKRGQRLPLAKPSPRKEGLDKVHI